MDKSEKTRNYIIETAAPVFNKKGYEGTSLSDIITKTGLSKGSIYGNFANKDELALAALDHNLNLISKHLIPFIKKHKSSYEKLRAYALFYRETYECMMKNGGCPILNTSVDSDDGNPHLKKRVLSSIHVWKDSLMRIVRRGRTNGEFKPETDPEWFAGMFISIIEGTMMLSGITGDPLYVDNGIDHILSIIDGIRV